MHKDKKEQRENILFIKIKGKMEIEQTEKKMKEEYKKKGNKKTWVESMWLTLVKWQLHRLSLLLYNNGTYAIVVLCIGYSIQVCTPLSNTCAFAYTNFTLYGTNAGRKTGVRTNLKFWHFHTRPRCVVD